MNAIEEANIRHQISELEEQLKYTDSLNGSAILRGKIASLNDKLSGLRGIETAKPAGISGQVSVKNTDRIVAMMTDRLRSGRTDLSVVCRGDKIEFEKD